MTQWGLDTLFNPAKKHMEEEKRRLQATREEIGDSSGGQRIDLESGKVTIERKKQPPATKKPKRKTQRGSAAKKEADSGQRSSDAKRSK